jgi:hypothetical protein
MSTRKPDNKSDLLLMLRSLAPAGEDVALEHRFHPKRMWRFDYAIVSAKLAIEYQGHGRMGGGSGHVGGHASISGIAKDAEKINEAQRLGWRVILVTGLHFREADRLKHKLSNPYDTIKSLLS